MADRRPSDDPRDGGDRPAPEDPALSAAARHALHDEELIAALAGADVDQEETARARVLVQRCSTCRDLYADLSAITVAIRATPNAEATGRVRSVTRDFRLTPRVAAELSGRPAVIGLAQRLGDAIRSFGRPAGFALASLGLVGLLVGTVGFGPMVGGPAGGLGTTSNGDPAAAPDVTFEPGELAPFATHGTDTRTESIEQVPTAVSWPVIVSALVLVAGLGLLLANAQLRWRTRSGP